MLATDRDLRQAVRRQDRVGRLALRRCAFCPRAHIPRTPPDPRWIRERRDHDHAPGSACCEADQRDREKSIRSVTTGPDFLGVCLGLILTRVHAPPEEQDSYSRTARMQETG